MTAIHHTAAIVSALLVLHAGMSVARAQNLVVNPYVQPGDGSTLGKSDVKVVAWLTDAVSGDFEVVFGQAGKPQRKVTPVATELRLTPEQHYWRYAALLSDLPLNAEIIYEVRRGEDVVAGGAFASRKTSDRAIRFLVVGDTGAGTPQQRSTAYHMSRAKPEFAIICGDVVYQRGLVSEYMSKFWPVYVNAAEPSPLHGAPMMQSVPFYVALGNHDAGVGADLAKFPDGGGAFYFFYPPRNGLTNDAWATPMKGSSEQLQQFRSATAEAGFPHLSLYSFDNGPAHFLVLDTNAYATVNAPALLEWIRRDLEASRSRWKFVFLHHPPFQSSASHWNDQRTRVLVTLFQDTGVDVVFGGHVHNYQRSKPLRFVPNEPLPVPLKGPVRGTITLDNTFDGAQDTTPDGIIYVVTGAGGAGLYTMGPKEAPRQAMQDPDAPEGYTAKFTDDRRSFTVIDLEPQKFVLQQLDENGDEIDRFIVTKQR